MIYHFLCITAPLPNGVDFTITNPEGEEILMGEPNAHASYYDLNINRKIKLKNNQHLYLNLDGKQYVFWPEHRIKELNKKMNNFERVKRKRDEYLKSLETKKE